MFEINHQSVWKWPTNTQQEK